MERSAPASLRKALFTHVPIGRGGASSIQSAARRNMGPMGVQEAVHTPTLSKQEKVAKYGEVFTPEWLVRDMCDMLEKESPDAFDPRKTFLEPTCGEGVFVCEILRRKFSRCHSRADYTTAISSVYAMEIQPDNVAKTILAVTELCEATFKLTKADRKIIHDHVIQADALKIMQMINDLNGRFDQIGNKNDTCPGMGHQ